MKNKVMSLLLTAIMILGLLPSTAMAAEANSVTVNCINETTGLPAKGVLVSVREADTTNLVSKTTDSTGVVEFQNVVSGSYIVKATAPAGFVIGADSAGVKLTGGTNSKVTFKCASQPAIKLVAVDTANRGIPGVAFTLSKMGNGAKIGTYVTNQDGTILVSGLDNIYYNLTVTNVPAGYVRDMSTKAVKPAIGQVTEIKWAQPKTTFVQIVAMLNGGSQGVEGVQISLSDKNGLVIATGNTDSFGVAKFTVPSGKYTVSAAAPDGYYVTVKEKTINVQDDMSTNINLETGKASAIVIKKTDKDTKDALAGAVYEIRNNKGMVMEILTTDGSGTATSQTLPAGIYSVGELYAPTGFVPDTQNHIAEIVDTNPCIVTLTNSAKSAVVLTAVDGVGQGLDKVQFAIYNAKTGALKETLDTNVFGVAISSNLEPGLYLVKETVIPGGFNLVSQNPIYLSVESKMASSAVFKHNEKGSLQIQTVNAEDGTPISGAKYSIHSATGTYIGDFTADEKGIVTTDVLSSGKYVIKQLVAPFGYSRSTSVVTAEVNEKTVALAKFYNEALSGIVIENVDQKTHSPLADCVFEIYDSDAKQIFHGTTGTTGILTTDFLAPGVYKIKELACPRTHSMQTQLKTVTVTTGQYSTVVFENKSLTGIQIQLVDGQTQQPLADAKFKVQQKDGDYLKEFVTDKMGLITITDVPVGDYMITETQSPAGYILKQEYQSISVSATAIADVKFVNVKLSGLTIQAVERNHHTGLGGAVFEIYEQNGKMVDELKTDTTGLVSTDQLAPGNYLIKEVEEPAGYRTDTATQTITITHDLNTTAVFNHQPYASMMIIKEDATTQEKLSGAVFELRKQNGDYVDTLTTQADGTVSSGILENGFYMISETKAPAGYLLDPTPHAFEVKVGTPVSLTITNDRSSGLKILKTVEQTGQGLGGVSFKVTTLDGQLIGNYQTDTNGIVYVPAVPGTYVVTETYAPEGFILDPASHNVVVTANKVTVLEVTNAKLSTITIHKTDAETGKGLYGAQFEIKDAKNNFVGRYTTDDSGYIDLTSVLAAGRYIVTEIKAPDGYVLDTTPRSLQVYTGKGNTLEWSNEPEAGQVTITKYSANDHPGLNLPKGSRLGGATFQICDMDGNAIQTITTNANGIAKSKKLLIGRYTVQEMKAPAGFQLNRGVATIHITAENDDIQLAVYNEPANVRLSIEKRGTKYITAGEQSKYYFTNVKNDSGCSVDNFTIRDYLPNAVNAVTLYSGSWSSSQTYAIEYMTNKHPTWTVLQGGLDSKNQYSFNLSSNALKLPTGERVTAIQMVFGTVPAGFHESVAPVLVVQAQPYLHSGYEVENKGLVLGFVDGSMCSAWSTWKSFIVNPFYPSRLPKTGY